MADVIVLDAVENVKKIVANTSDDIGATNATGGSNTTGTVNAKLNTLINNTSHGSISYDTAGTRTWKCPEGVHQITVSVVSATGGGGGGGGGGCAGQGYADYNYTYYGGSGGSGGSGSHGEPEYYLSFIMSVTPQNNYQIVCGAGGIGGKGGSGGAALVNTYTGKNGDGADGTDGTNGGDSYIGNILIKGTHGGFGGTGGTAGEAGVDRNTEDNGNRYGISGIGGTGGIAAYSIGNVVPEILNNNVILLNVDICEIPNKNGNNGINGLESNNIRNCGGHAVFGSKITSNKFFSANGGDSGSGGCAFYREYTQDEIDTGRNGKDGQNGHDAKITIVW